MANADRPKSSETHQKEWLILIGQIMKKSIIKTYHEEWRILIGRSLQTRIVKSGEF